MNAKWSMVGLSWLLLATAAEAQLNNPPRPDRQGGRGPWDNDVLVYRLEANNASAWRHSSGRACRRLPAFRMDG